AGKPPPNPSRAKEASPQLQSNRPRARASARAPPKLTFRPPHPTNPLQLNPRRRLQNFLHRIALQQLISLPHSHALVQLLLSLAHLSHALAHLSHALSRLSPAPLHPLAPTTT